MAHILAQKLYLYIMPHVACPDSVAGPEHKVAEATADGQPAPGPLQRRGLRRVQREGHRRQDLHGEPQRHSAGHGNAIGPPVDRHLPLHPADLRVSLIVAFFFFFFCSVCVRVRDLRFLR